MSNPPKKRSPWMRLFTLVSPEKDASQKARLERLREIGEYRNTLKFRGK